MNIIGTEVFSGKAQAYAKARPGYPDAAMEHICALVPAGAVFADVGAGTGKFTVLLARYTPAVFAVEPNADMRGELAAATAACPNVTIVGGAAEATTLPDSSVDVVICAQALHWFDADAFRAECRRIGRPGGIAVAVYNNMPGGSINNCNSATTAFFANPAVAQFPNPIVFTRESWLTYMTSHSRDPLPDDPGYAAHIDKASAIFDRESADGLLRHDAVTKVYSERIADLP